ncbi:MAG: L-ribulose-5-phosphate 4-epimerase [Candidatus Omnitrophica bacterium]|nr:L-ribulose-5-phosphate 4-epimerase [Candidatus Omnitrophota bacterium]MCK4423840.1 L-ribulose-5-phosphate 4-epimerase [Candidatus Omnitrophota bacterium]
MGQYKNLKEIAWQSNLELPKHDLVTYTFGNASSLDRDKGVIAIKPSGLSYDDLKPEDMVIVDLENNIVEGNLNPSSDTKTHLVLYRNFPEIAGVVHTHSTYAAAWSQAIKPITIFGTTQADYLPMDIPCTKIISDEAIKGDYEEETGSQILEVFKDISYKEVEMVLVACHGPFTWGKTPAKAVHNSVVLEELAKMAMLTLQINPDTGILKKTIIDKHYQRKHGKDAYYGQGEN